MGIRISRQGENRDENIRCYEGVGDWNEGQGSVMEA